MHAFSVQEKIYKAARFCAKEKDEQCFLGLCQLVSALAVIRIFLTAMRALRSGFIFHNNVLRNQGSLVIEKWYSPFTPDVKEFEGKPVAINTMKICEKFQKAKNNSLREKFGDYQKNSLNLITN